MKLWFDDIRQPPNQDWYWAKTIEAATPILCLGNVDFASLDHDLGYGCKTGYDFVKWMAEHDIWPKDGIVVHSWNYPGAKNMCSVIDRYGPYDEPTQHVPCDYYKSPIDTVEQGFHEFMRRVDESNDER